MFSSHFSNDDLVSTCYSLKMKFMSHKHKYLDPRLQALGTYTVKSLIRYFTIKILHYCHKHQEQSVQT